MDYHAKKAIWETTQDPEALTQQFPLEPICIFLGKNKLTSDKGDKLKFWVQRQQARSYFHNADIVYGLQFDTINWEMVHTTLCRALRMFQIWACKQVMDIGPANGNRPWEQNLCPLCPNCAHVNKTCLHILFCNYAGWVDALMTSVNLLEQWLEEVDTDPDLLECTVQYARGKGQLAMLDAEAWTVDTPRWRTSRMPLDGGDSWREWCAEASGVSKKCTRLWTDSTCPPNNGW
jgi:hypothetical protein